MLVLGVNRILEWVQVLSNGRRYTCPMKIVDGERFFFFKKEWHKVFDFLSDNAEELMYEGSKIVSKKIK